MIFLYEYKVFDNVMINFLRHNKFKFIKDFFNFYLLYNIFKYKKKKKKKDKFYFIWNNRI